MDSRMDGTSNKIRLIDGLPKQGMPAGNLRHLECLLAESARVVIIDHSLIQSTQGPAFARLSGL